MGNAPLSFSLPSRGSRARSWQKDIVLSGISTSKQSDLKHSRLLETLAYDPETGVFRAKIDRAQLRAGDIVGNNSHRRGYQLIRLDYARFLAHRLAWFYVMGEWPSGEIDHIDGDPANNRIANLRIADRQQNCWNTAAAPRKGAVIRNIKFKGKRVQVMFARGNTRVYHKSFPTLCQAIHSRNRMAKELYGNFARGSN
jgi:hypothetical protein